MVEERKMRCEVMVVVILDDTGGTKERWDRRVTRFSSIGRLSAKEFARSPGRNPWFDAGRFTGWPAWVLGAG